MSQRQRGFAARSAIAIGMALATPWPTLAADTRADGQTAPPPIDDLVDRTCGSNPLERKVAARLTRANLGERELVALNKCANWDLQGGVGTRLPIKALKLLDVKAEAALRDCLHVEMIREPKVVDLLTGYVRAAFEGNDADRHMQQEYAACYANVLRCRRHPCPGARAARPQDQASGPLRLAVRLLAAPARTPGAPRFEPLDAAAALRSGDKVVFEVTPSRAAYVYIVQKTAVGQLNVLFPHPEIALRNPLAPALLRLPPQRNYELDKDAGRESVFVVASLREQVDLRARLDAARKASNAERPGAQADQAQRALGTALAKVAATDRPATTNGPRAGRSVTRGLILASGTSDDAAKAPDTATRAEAAPGDDTVVVQLDFDHLPRSAP